MLNHRLVLNTTVPEQTESIEPVGLTEVELPETQTVHVPPVDSKELRLINHL